MTYIRINRLVKTLGLSITMSQTRSNRLLIITISQDGVAFLWIYFDFVFLGGICIIFLFRELPHSHLLSFFCKTRYCSVTYSNEMSLYSTPRPNTHSIPPRTSSVRLLLSLLDTANVSSQMY